ncbi:outer membrane protein assembly factor BamB family protein [Phytohabitans rumicis]|uniref:Pyrrolo-quinoline quinone repeat domain-containing protein n=1 Tax=Phytohabitans rumicis TaxID=1076125 RepID=A0A6V8LRM3_9ACTN|nr:PQQ-binding-like beta-propeller repeat protein [Phytohabitans rumicis]GFJ95395.1 hypothetical protein Prum_090370 [Phytohabitans rumicis]
MSVIDLDVVSAAAPTARYRPWHRWPGVVAAVAALLLLLGGAAVPVERPWDRPVVLDGVPLGGMAAAGDTLYLARPGGVVTAHPAGGGQRWSAPLGEADRLVADAVGDLVLLQGVVADTGPRRVFTAVVEAATGVPRWRRDGTVRLIDRAAGLVVLADDPAAVPGPFSYRLLELATGQEVWLWGARPDGATLTPVGAADGALAGLLQRDAAGRTVLLDAATRRSRPLPDTPQATDAYGTDDGLLLRAFDDARVELVMYDWATLRPRWRVAAPLNGLLLGRCGPWLCVTDGEGTAAVDPADGQVRWQRPGAPNAPGQPLVLHAFNPAAPAVTLVDPVTGRPVLELAGWTGVGAPAAGRQVATRWRVDGRTQIVAVELASQRVYPLAEAVVAADSCVTSERLLACRSGAGTLTMWRLG